MPDLKPTAKGEKTRTAIIEAAHTLFLSQGFNGTSMRDIAEATGLALGGIYNHFENKEEVFGAVLDAYHPYHHLLPILEKTQGESLEEFVQDLSTRLGPEVGDIEKNLLPLALADLLEFRGRYIKRIGLKIIPPIFEFFKKFKSPKSKLRKFPVPVMARTLFSLIIGYFLTEMLLNDMPLVKSQMSKDAFDQMLKIYLYGVVES